MSARIAAVVLAAGASRRYGPANKLVADLDGTPLVARAVDAVRAADPVFVVLGTDPAPVRAALVDRSVMFVVNPEPEKGMASSIARGVAVARGHDGLWIALGDMPGVRTETVQALLAAFTGRRAIVVPTFEGERGHPVLFGADHFGELMRLEGDRGARGVLEANGDCVVEVAVDDPGILRDVDTPADL